MPDFNYSSWPTARGLWGEIHNRASWTERDIARFIEKKEVIDAKALLKEYEARHTALVSALWVKLFRKEEK